MKTPEEHYEAVMAGKHPEIGLYELLAADGSDSLWFCEIFNNDDGETWGTQASTPKLAVLAAISSWQKKGGV